MGYIHNGLFVRPSVFIFPLIGDNEIFGWLGSLWTDIFINHLFQDVFKENPDSPIVPCLESFRKGLIMIFKDTLKSILAACTKWMPFEFCDFNEKFDSNTKTAVKFNCQI